MADFQIARNIGAMFENATKSFNLNLDKNVSLPPSVTAFINTNYYNVETNFTTKEIVKALNSSNDNEIYTVLKHLAKQLSIKQTDNDIIQLFPHIIKNINSTNIKIKRLVYLILLRFNHLQPDISLLSINAIQKSLTDKSCINRSLAIRCLSGIKIPAILPILLLSLKRTVKDSSPLVRSASAIAIMKCFELDNFYNNKRGKPSKVFLIDSLKDDSSIISQLYKHLDILLSDNDSKVLSIALISYHQCFNGCYDLIHNKINHFINKLNNSLDNYSVVILLDLLVDYSKLYFPSYKNDGINFPIELNNLLMSLNFLIYSSDENVILSLTKCIIELFPFKIRDFNCESLLLKFTQVQPNEDLSSNQRVLLILNEIYFLITSNHLNFKNSQISNFIPLTNDTLSIGKMKVLILFKLIKEDNFEIILNELKFLIENSEFNINLKFKVLQNLNKLILLKNLSNDQLSRLIRFFMLKLQTEKNEILIGEYITGLRQLIQSNLGGYIDILIKLTGKLIESNDSELISSSAKASIIWLLGEFSINSTNYNDINKEKIELLKNYLPDFFRILINKFKFEDSSNVRLQILMSISKLLIVDIFSNGKSDYKLTNNTIFKLFNYVLQLTRFDSNLDIRDRSRLVGALLPNIIYYSNTTIHELDIDELLDNDPTLLEHCVQKCNGIELSILLFQLNKPHPCSDKQLDFSDDELSCIKKYNQVSKDRLDLDYLQYYNDLRSQDFEIKDYNKYSNSISSSTVFNKIVNDSQSPVLGSNTPRNFNSNYSDASSTPGTFKSKSANKYKLQTLDDFLGPAGKEIVEQSD